MSGTAQKNGTSTFHGDHSTPGFRIMPPPGPAGTAKPFRPRAATGIIRSFPSRGFRWKLRNAGDIVASVLLTSAMVAVQPGWLGVRELGHGAGRICRGGTGF